MRFVECDLFERGYQYITLNVTKDNADAIRLYQRLGYLIKLWVHMPAGGLCR